MKRLAALVVALVATSSPTVLAEGAGGAGPALGAVQARVSVAASHTCAIVDVGRVACWGVGLLGRLGYGNTTNIGDTEKPAANAVDGGYVALPGGRGAVAIATGNSHTCAVLDTGRVTCWGDGASGALGYGNINPIGDTETPALNPVNGGLVALPENLAATAVTAGNGFSCALLVDDSVTCWGDAAFGQLGYGNLTDIGDTETPAQNPVNNGRVPLPGGRTAKKIDAGLNSVCAILDNDSVTCWGNGASGRLGYGNVNSIGDTETPAQNPVNGGILQLTNSADSAIVGVAVGVTHACAVTAGGALRCWGEGAGGRLGYGNVNSIGDTETPALNPVNGGAVALPGNARVVSVAAGASHTCVILTLGTVACFGVGALGRIGYGNVSNIGDTETPAMNAVNGGVLALAGNERAVAIALGESACAVLESGSFTCWGPGALGALGYGNITTIGDTETPAANPVDGGRVSLPGGHGATALFVPLSPARLMDTRPGGVTVDGLQAGGTIVSGGQERLLFVSARAGIPLDASAYSLNVTITEPLGPGFLTVYPCGVPRPTASNLNYIGGQTIANGVSVKAGLAGNVCLFSSQTTHIVVDVGGYFPKSSKFTFITPARVLDTRPGMPTIDGQFSGGGANVGTAHIQLPISGRGGVPAGDAKVLVISVVATGAAADGYITVYPCGTARFTASNVNFRAGETVANSVTVLAFVNGRVCLYSNVTVDMVVDVHGYLDFNVDTFARAGAPVRLLDTRPAHPTFDGIQAGIGLLGQGQEVRVNVTTRAQLTPVATSVILNITVTEPQVPGFVTAYPCGTARPTASSLNYVAGQTIANSVTVKVGVGGEICLYTLSPTHLVADFNAYYL